MKKNRQFRDAISLLLVFVLMTEFTGCYSFRVIQPTDITSGGDYFIHTKTNSYPACNPVTFKDTINFRIDLEKRAGKRASTHVYLTDDSVLVYRNGSYTIPLSGISKMRQQIPDPSKTRLLIGITVAAVLVGAAVGLTAAVISLIEEIITTPIETSSTGLCTNW